MQYETKDLVNSSSIFDKEKFDYDQLVSSVYASGIIDLTNDYSLLAGVRFENTNIKGSWLNNSYNSFDNNYNVIHKEYLIDEDKLKEKQKIVANQGKAK